MDSKFWTRKVLSLCLSVAIIATYSAPALATSEKIAGEISISGKTAQGQNLFVKIDGENAQSGRSIFSASTIATPDNASAIVNLGKAGKIELAPNTIVRLSFDEANISGDLSAGQITVLSSLTSMTVKTTDNKTIAVKAGESVAAANGKAQTDDDDDNGSSLLLYAVILGGAVAGIVYAATSDNKISLGGGSTVVSTNR
jgi:hypothetical protein